MNSVGGLIDDDKSAVASVMCVVMLVCNSLADKCLFVLGEYYIGPFRSVN